MGNTLFKATAFCFVDSETAIMSLLSEQSLKLLRNITLIKDCCSLHLSYIKFWVVNWRAQPPNSLESVSQHDTAGKVLTLVFISPASIEHGELSHRC